MPFVNFARYSALNRFIGTSHQMFWLCLLPSRKGVRQNSSFPWCSIFRVFAGLNEDEKGLQQKVTKIAKGKNVVKNFVLHPSHDLNYVVI